MKKYYQLRFCKNCDKQRMVDTRGYCQNCNRANKKQDKKRAYIEGATYRTRAENTFTDDLIYSQNATGAIRALLFGFAFGVVAVGAVVYILVNS